MPEDVELKAMQAIVQVLDEIDTDARQRVIAWIADRYGISFGAKKGSWIRNDRGEESDNATGYQFDSFSDLFDATAPDTESGMALVGGYWFQSVQANADFSSQQVNDELKNLGHALSNVTRAFDVLREAKPAMVRQIQKSGKTKQARKRYRLTEAGIKAVRGMVKDSEGEE
jgi:hypothetical protein